MKYLYLISFLLISNLALGQATKTVHQAFSSSGIEKIVLNLNSPNVEVKETKGSRVLVEVTVSICSPSNAMIEYLANAGRFELLAQEDETANTMTIYTKKNNDVLMYKGQPCEETFHYVIYVPEHIRYMVGQDKTTASK